MRTWMMGAALAAGMAGAAWAQGSEIENAISNQIAAFKADDFAQAFAFASPAIRGIFGTPENFARMVTQGYPMVWRPAEVSYLELRYENGSYWQKVRIVDGKGRVHILDYRMLDTETGWKINGVQLLESAGLST